MAIPPPHPVAETVKASERALVGVPERLREVVVDEVLAVTPGGRDPEEIAQE